MSSSKQTSSNYDEEERLKDIAERDAYAERLREKDQKRTRNVATKSDERMYAEAAKRLKLENEDRKAIVPKLREESRKNYLIKRKADQLVLLEGEIKDEEQIFGDVPLTKAEKAEYEYKKKVLTLAKEHEQAKELESIRRYHIPEESKPSKVYEEIDEREKQPNAEARKWEEERLNVAKLSFGAKDKAKKVEEYDILIDASIDFIKALTVGGQNTDEKDIVDEETAKRMTIAETRRSLPIYAYKRELIKAVKEHQILIIEEDHYRFMLTKENSSKR